MSTSVVRLHIRLLAVPHPIWRRVEVPNDITLHRLHLIIQDVMGWENVHLYAFSIGEALYGEADADLGFKSSKHAKLAKALGSVTKFRYEYDFGDSWQHVIEVESIHQADPEKRYPLCLAGKGACPPEDSGGAPGYTHLLEVLADPDHEEHEEMLEWLGRAFDPNDFDVQEANARLSKHWRQPKAEVAASKVLEIPSSPPVDLSQLRQAVAMPVSYSAAPAPLATEQLMLGLSRTLAGQSFANLDAVRAFIDAKLGRQAMEQPAPRSSLEAAQDLAMQAWQAQGEARYALAEQALAEDARCSDAWLILAEQRSSWRKRLKVFEKAVEVAEQVRQGRPELLEPDDDGQVRAYGHPQLRPWFRAKMALARQLWDGGSAAEARDHYEDILSLDADDHLGARYELAYVCHDLEDYTRLAALLERFADDTSTQMAYERAWLSWYRHGDNEQSRQLRDQAIAANRYVVRFFAHPEEGLGVGKSSYYTPGSSEEAVMYLNHAVKWWLATPGATAWLVAALGE